jgi:hypothetical protein
MRLPFRLILCLLSLGLGFTGLARDLTSYRVGDVADADVVTPMALEVVDTAATAEFKSAKARQYPAIFRSFPEATNQMTQDFLAAFAHARTNFLVEMTNEFHVQTLDEGPTASAEFGRLVTAFGVENRSFPVTDELAAEWARGKDGRIIQEELLTVLHWAANRQVRPDTLPEGMTLGETVRLVPVTEPDQKLSFEAAQQGQLVPAASLITVSNVQALFRREFPARQQLLARALASLIRPNCLPDAPLTKLTRGTVAFQMVVTDHFDAGDAIVRQGDTIDAKARAALLALAEKLKAVEPAAVAVASVQPPPKAAPQPAFPPSSPQAPPPDTLTKAAPAPAVVQRVVTVASSKPVVKAGRRHIGLVLTLAGISFAALLVALGQYWRQRNRSATSAAVAQVPLPLPGAVKADLTPQVAQAVREAVQQELASQRRELLLAQQAATDEIASLVRRLDELQVPMQQRLQTYETRIQTLETELALRNEENRELLKLKIETTARQLEAERAANLVPRIAAP